MLRTLIKKTAWPMTAPAPWSAFHVIFLFLGLAWAFCLILLLCGRLRPLSRERRFLTMDFDTFVLWICGVILAVSEVYKQLFLYEIVNNRTYDWWYFPFQLCSTPMYVCLLFPLLPQGEARTAAAVYVQSFGFLGGVMALLEPSGLMHSYWTLTLHGLLWHIMLIFLALYCTASGLAKAQKSSFFKTILLFLLFCLIATAINVLTGGRADMFYISPYYPVTQAVFHEISLVIGTFPGIAFYLISICAGAGLSRRLLNRLYAEFCHPHS